LASLFHHFLDPAKPLKLQQAWSENLTLTSRGLSFWHRIPIRIPCFSWNRSGTSPFLIFWWFMLKSWDFGTPQNSDGLLLGGGKTHQNEEKPGFFSLTRHLETRQNEHWKTLKP
jgi:hypothetical protein